MASVQVRSRSRTPCADPSGVGRAGGERVDAGGLRGGSESVDGGERTFLLLAARLGELFADQSYRCGS